MAFLFGGRRRRSPEDDGEEDRSGGGRAQRRRLSPDEDAASPAAAAAGSSPGWLSSFVFGARRVISSVMLFSSPEEAASGEEDDDGEEEGNGLSSDENEHVHYTRGAIVPYNESKLAIEQMVMKETFSRDECDKMVELIKSRVTDSTFPEAYEYGTPKENTSRNAGIGHDFTGTWRSLSRSRNFRESVPFSSIGPGSFSPGSPLKASPELCTAAVTEAKKWLEEKRQGLGSKPEENGPCTFNTDMLSSGVDSDMGSPVDLAKSYMLSLPPWQSPFLGSQKFNLSPTGGVHIYSDEEKSKYSVSSSKVTTKEDYTSNFWANLEESRRARIGLSGISPDSSKLGHHGSTSRFIENDTSLLSLGPHHEKVGESSQTIKGPDKVAATEPASGCSTPVTQTKDANATNGTVEHVDTAEKDNGRAHEENHASTEAHPDKVEEGDDIFPTSITKDAIDQSGVAEAQAPTAEPASVEDSGVSHLLVTKCPPEGSATEAKAEINLYVSLSKSLSSEFRLKDGGLAIQCMNGSANKTSANGLLDQSKANSGLESSGKNNPSCTNSNSAVPPNSKGVTESASDAADGDSVENGTGMNQEKQTKGASKPSYVQRGQKRVTRVTRSRGRGK